MKISTTIICLLSLSVSMHAFAGNIPGGSYTRSCSNVQFIQGQGLFATCDTMGVYFPTAIKHVTFAQLQSAQPANLHGNLVATGLVPKGSWSATCLGSTYDDATHLLMAACDYQGDYRQSYIIATPSQTVYNNDGKLVLGS